MRCTRITTMVRMTDSVSATPTAWTNPLRDPRDLRLPRIAGPVSYTHLTLPTNSRV